MPKHDGDMGGTGKKNIGGQLELTTKLTFSEASAPVSGLKNNCK